MKNSNKKPNVKKIITVIVCFMFMLSIGFVAGNKLGKKSVTTASNKQVETSENKNTNKTTASISETQTTTNNTTNTSVVKDKTSTIEDKTATTEPIDSSKKVAYLTFDDGPTRKITPRVLKTLDEFNVKATFFVLGQQAKAYPELIKEERAKGHAIANHSYDHNYKTLYSNPANFVDEFEKTNKILKSILGEYDGKVIRFPGGSYGKKRFPYKKVAKDAGFTYVDWNALTGDAEHSHVPVDQLVSRVKSSTKDKNIVVILMHDAATKSTSADALPQVIQYLKSQGYEFRTLNEQGKIPSNVPSVH